MTLEYKKHNIRKIFFLILGLAFIVFLFTSDGHRYAIDELHSSEMAYRMTTLEPDPAYVQDESKVFFNVPIYNPRNVGSLCANPITCYPASVFHSATQVPFMAANHYMNFISSETLVLDVEDFRDPHYIHWRNSQNVDVVFMELFYGPFFSSLSVAIFFLICIEQKFSRTNSIILTLILAFSTTVWAYSNTSLNLVPGLFFVLLGYLFFKKFQNLHQYRFLIFSSAAFGFGFLIRSDVILFILPIWIFLIVSHSSFKKKLLSVSFFSIPSLFVYYIYKTIPGLRYRLDIVSLPDDAAIDDISECDLIKNPAATGDACTLENPSAYTDLTFFMTAFSVPFTELMTRIFGIFFAPGVGLFIFCPILLTIFFSFIDYFRKNRAECVLILSFFVLNIIYHTASTGGWHGLVGWGPRYLFLMIPFLLIPLGASLEQRNRWKILPIILILAVIGAFFNTVYVIQDVAWFVWSRPGTEVGLFGLEGFKTAQMYLVSDVIWTFQYSQLTHSIITAFEQLQHDIYILHILGPIPYSIIFTFSVSILSYLFYRVFRSKKISHGSLEN